MVVTQNGKIDIAKAVLDYMKRYYNYFGVGTSTAEFESGMNDLVNPIEWQQGSRIYRKPVEDIIFDGENIIFKCKLRFNEFNSTGGKIYEIGIFNRLMGGQMLLRVVIPDGIVKNNLIEKTIDVKMKLW